MSGNTILRRVTIGLIVAAVLIALVLVKRLSGRVGEIPDNPADTIGNTAGNLYNGGTFCEAQGVVYFANPYDGGALYAMNADQTELRRVVSGNVSFLNLGGDYLYYYSASASDQSGLGYVRNGRGLYRVDTAGKNNILLRRLTTDGMLLLGNTLVFTEFAEDTENPDNAQISIETLPTSGGDAQRLALAHPVLGASLRGEPCYAGTVGNHRLYTMELSSGRESQIADLDLYLPIPQGAYIYYLDLSDDYHLKSYSLADGSISVLAAERIDSYNLYGDMIYYQTVDARGGDGYALKRVRVDGSEPELVRSGVHTDLQITSSYVYFKEFGNDVPVYCTPTYGSVNIRIFDAAMEAALRYQQ